MADKPIFVKGLWIPRGDEQLRVGLQAEVKKQKRPVVDGQIAWRYDRITMALQFLPENRRRCAIDVGAHIGLWARWLARDFQVTFAFEPVRRHYDLLVRNLIDGYDHIVTIPEAIGDANLHICMTEEIEVSGRSHVRLEEEPEVGAGSLVPMRTLDSWNFKEVDLLKIDVEGFERRVLEGGEQTIMEWKPVIVIEQLGHEVRYGDQRDAALDLLKSWGAIELCPDMKGDHYLGWAA